MKKKMSWIGIACVLALGLSFDARAQVPGPKHLVVIGVDGLSPDGIAKAKAPAMKQLMSESAWTMRARAVMPTVSSPNWASMIMGAGPEQHGVTSNDWRTNQFEIAPTVMGPGGMFPTIFGLVREQRPDAVQACFHDWDGFGRLFEREAVDRIEDADGPTNTVASAVAFFAEKKPLFTFIHLDHVDGAGHKFGHGTPEYYESVAVADKLIMRTIEGLRSAGMLRETVIIITSDHGGIGKGHGGATMAEIEIPWIIHGPGVKRGHEITTPVNTYDTAVTAAFVLGLDPHPAWIGKNVAEAFE